MKSDIYVAPNDSEDHRFFRRLHQEIGVSERSVRKLFWLINAPAKLTAISQIMSNLKSIIKIIVDEQAFGPQLVEAPWLEWIQLADYVEENISHLSSHLGEHILPYAKLEHRRDTHPMRRKGMTRHALYTSLWNLHQDLELQDTYCRTQAHIFYAHIKLLQSSSSMRLYESHNGELPFLSKVSDAESTHDSIDKACRFLRDLSLVAHSDDLNELTNPIKFNNRTVTPLYLSTEDLADYLITEHNSLRNKFQSELTNKFGLFFSHIFSPFPTIDRSGGGGGYRRKINYRTHDGFIRISPSLYQFLYPEIDADDDDLIWGEQRTYVESMILDDGEAGLAEHENESGFELHLVKEKKKSRLPYLARVLAAEAQVNQTALSNQMLPNRWAIMTSWEATQFIQYMHKQLQLLDVRKPSPKQVRALETVTLAIVMFVTGSSLERALKLGITNKTSLPKLDFTYNLDSKSFLLKNNILKYRTQPTLTQITKSRLIEPKINLPDLMRVNEFIQLLKKQRNIPDDSHLFHSSQKKHQTNLNTLFKGLPQGHRITTHKVSTYLFNTIVEQTAGDIVTASLITCSAHHLSKTPLHYTTLSSNNLREVYMQTISHIQGLIQEESSIPTEMFFSHQPIKTQSNRFFGSRLCPKSVEIRSFVLSLSKKIMQGPVSRDLEDIIDYHNTYTIFTSSMLLFATGFRAVKNPFIPAERMNPQNGISLISDKDGEDYYNSRLTWLPDMVRAQLNHYADHRLSLLNTLQLYSTRQNTSYPDMFLLSSKGDVRTLQPKHVMHIVGQTFPFPLNANRKYLRTQLVELGCPIEVINSFMGHWANGEEPWGKYSTLSFETTLEHLNQYIPAILQSLHWLERPSRIAL